MRLMLGRGKSRILTSFRGANKADRLQMNNLGQLRSSFEWSRRHGKKRDEGGFPLLPDGIRTLRLPLRHDEQPDRVRVKVGHTTVEGLLQ